MSLCEECGLPLENHMRNQCDAEQIRKLRLEVVELRMGQKPSHTVRDYRAPHLLQLRLEDAVVQAAAKWWKLEDFLKTHQDAHRTVEFLVQLAKG